MKYNLADIVFHKEYNQIYKIIKQYDGQTDTYYNVQFIKPLDGNSPHMMIISAPCLSFESKTRLLTTEEKIELL